MTSLWDLALFCLPAALFLPVAYLLFSKAIRSAGDSDDATYPRSASLLMSGVMIALIIAWTCVVYGHFFGG